MNPIMKKLLAAATVAGVFTAGVAIGPGAVLAQDSTDTTSSTVVEETAGDVAEAPDFGFDEETIQKLDACDAIYEAAFGDLFDEDLDSMPVPTDEELAQMNSDTQDLIDALEEAGISVTVIDSDGYLDFEIGDLTDDQFELMDSVFDELYGADDLEMTDGYADLGLDPETEKALEDCDAVYEEAFENMDDFDFDFTEELTAEELAEINAETQQLIDALNDAGIPIVVSDLDGFIDFEIGDVTEEQDAVIEEIFTEVFGNMVVELSDEDKAAINAEEQDLAAYLDAAGISYEMIDLEEGVSVVDIDWDDEAAVEAYSSYWGEDDDFDLIDPDIEELDAHSDN